ncbi:PRAME family member 8-like [Perognathus longimembris pacificus]|uniref:PRAME family member 8-like n=1 Tax=Perognathus longimembris pacificus TaxID=214514 RepID=UPI00201852A1|nr:PRAME family member 8-like [Perognathus longimembris pacificus]
MTEETAPSLQRLATHSLLSHPALAISALDDLPVLLFPSLFMEAYTGGHREVLKAMVQAWPFPCLPLGALAQSPGLETVKAVLDALDLRLAQKEHPSGSKLLVFNLRKEHPEFWIRGYTSMVQTSYQDNRTEKTTLSCCSGITEEQALIIAMDLTIKDGARNPTQTYLLQWARERKEQVHLCSRKMKVQSESISEMQKALLVVNLDSIQELELTKFLGLETMQTLAPYLSGMKNLHILKISMKGTSWHTFSPKWEAYLEPLKHLQELHVQDAIFCPENLSSILRSLPPLKALSLSHCVMMESHLWFLSCCPYTRQLKHLRLRHLFMDDISPEPLRALLEHVASNLETLALECCHITDSELSFILPTLSQCSQLRFFSFYGNRISMAALQNLLSHTARLGHLRRGLYPAPVESYCPQTWWDESIDPDRFALIQTGLTQPLRGMKTKQKVQICTHFSHLKNKCQFYSLEPDGSWVVTKEELPSLSALPV